ncbi:phosphate acyltransferase [Collinsella provencensis]|uniref:phosphate acyltransferase n=1 Tax=Collinsella provencensis TaxID=1937461 RepID=UPI000C84792B|nr:phosphate acyltransferase [Collinsella provencensis]
MSLMDQLRERACAARMKVAFPEGDDETMMRAVAELTEQGIADCVLVGNGEELRSLASERGISLDGIEIADITDEVANAALAERYLALPDCPFKAKGVARRLVRPMEHAFILQALGDVDITFAGISCSTGDVILAGQTIIGLADGIDTVSSVGIFDIPGYEGSEGNLLGFGDSAVCANPDASQLASIAISACETVAALTQWDPRCALLSYSTCGSATGELVDKVIAARDIANERRPDLKIDGEFQFDSAINPRTAARKVPRDSEVAGRANIVIWPDLNVGNVGVKLVQQFAHADAYGPMLQGFKKIVCDCSRSAGVSEIVGNVIMSCVRAAVLKGEA